MTHQEAASTAFPTGSEREDNQMSTAPSPEEVLHGASLTRDTRVYLRDHPRTTGTIRAGWGINSRKIAVAWDTDPDRMIDGYTADDLTLMPKGPYKIVRIVALDSALTPLIEGEEPDDQSAWEAAAAMSRDSKDHIVQVQAEDLVFYTFHAGYQDK